MGFFPWGRNLKSILGVREIGRLNLLHQALTLAEVQLDRKVMGKIFLVLTLIADPDSSDGIKQMMDRYIG